MKKVNDSTTKQNALDHDTLTELLDYNPDTGIFTWKKFICSKAQAGQVAGSVDKKGYIIIRINGFAYRAHRLAWFYVHCKWPLDQLDHLNQVKTDNRMSNLRQCSAAGNNRNRSLPKNNKSGQIGVYEGRAGKAKKMFWIAVNPATKLRRYFPHTSVGKNLAIEWRLMVQAEQGFSSNHGKRRKESGKPLLNS